jgi:hypothetical protein
MPWPQPRALAFIRQLLPNLAPQLEAVWNERKLRDEDLSDPDRLTALLKEQLLPAAGKVTDEASDSHTHCRRAR